MAKNNYPGRRALIVGICGVPLLTLALATSTTVYSSRAQSIAPAQEQTDNEELRRRRPEKPSIFSKRDYALARIILCYACTSLRPMRHLIGMRTQANRLLAGDETRSRLRTRTRRGRGAGEKTPGETEVRKPPTGLAEELLPLHLKSGIPNGWPGI